MITVVALILVAVAFGVAAYFAILTKLERRALRRERSPVMDEHVAANGLYPERRLEVKAVSKIPPRAPRR